MERDRLAPVLLDVGNPGDVAVKALLMPSLLLWVVVALLGIGLLAAIWVAPSLDAFALGERMAAHLGLPERVIRKAPSADLWQGQTDEEERH